MRHGTRGRPREIQVAVLDDEALGAIEVVPAREFYDYAAKYTAGTTQYFYPARIPPAHARAVLDAAEVAHRGLGCDGVTRTDFILTADGTPYILEVNTLPGMTAIFLLAFVNVWNEFIAGFLLITKNELKPAMFGPSVPVHLTSYMEGRGRPRQSGPLDSNGRRSIYLNVRRNFLNPMFLAFDAPVPFADHQKALKPFAGHRVLDQVRAEPEAYMRNANKINTVANAFKGNLDLPDIFTGKKVVGVSAPAKGNTQISHSSSQCACIYPQHFCSRSFPMDFSFRKV